jgi:crotonobetainyl-CoA:carnitine CoA-transferase CaiB-like acyl-CoA transferase
MSAGALAGIKVVDLSCVLGGPLCGQTLADHGAEVIKVEPPSGDVTRGWGWSEEEAYGSYFIGLNRNKRSLVVDLGTPEGRDVVFRLLEDADVMIENFKAGTLEKWEMGYEDVLSERFPRLVHCRVTGFGTDGPLGKYPGYDAVLQAAGGIMSVNGDRGGDAVRVGIPLVDIGTGMWAVTGVLMALLERHTSGRGQSVEACLYDTAIGLLHPVAAGCLMTGDEPERWGNAHPSVAPYDKYNTGSGEIFVGIGTDQQFQRMCKVLGKPELSDDERFTTNVARATHQTDLREALEALMAGQDGPDLCLKLLDASVPASPVNSVPDTLTHPHTLHREMVAAVDGVKMTGIPVKLDRTPGTIETAPPRFGADGRAILKEYGFSDDTIDGLVATGAVAEPSN